MFITNKHNVNEQPGEEASMSSRLREVIPDTETLSILSGCFYFNGIPPLMEPIAANGGLKLRILVGLDVYFRGQAPRKLYFSVLFRRRPSHHPSFGASCRPSAGRQSPERIHFQFTFLSPRCGMMHLSPREAADAKISATFCPKGHALEGVAHKTAAIPFGRPRASATRASSGRLCA